MWNSLFMGCSPSGKGSFSVSLPQGHKIYPEAHSSKALLSTGSQVYQEPALVRACSRVTHTPVCVFCMGSRWISESLLTLMGARKQPVSIGLQGNSSPECGAPLCPPSSMTFLSVGLSISRILTQLFSGHSYFCAKSLLSFPFLKTVSLRRN